MNAIDASLLNELANRPIVSTHWKADLTLTFSRENERSLLSKRQHIGPLVVQKTLHPEGAGVCHGIIIHPPGGVAGGDALTLNANLEHAAHALLTTPGAGKWYKANGQQASQQLNFKLAQSASLEWLPQENILFDGSNVALSAEVDLAEESVYAAWDIVCFGRQAQAERWQSGALRQTLKIRRNRQLIWQECSLLNPQHCTLTSKIGLGGNVVSGSFVVAAGSVPAEVREACQQVVAEGNAMYGVTALPHIFSARYVGDSAPLARKYFEALWMILRPWYAGREAVRPRIWNT